MHIAPRFEVCACFLLRPVTSIAPSLFAVDGSRFSAGPRGNFSSLSAISRARGQESKKLDSVRGMAEPSKLVAMRREVIGRWCSVALDRGLARAMRPHRHLRAGDR